MHDASPIALKRSTPRAGPNAGGNDAQAAPARVTNPRGGTAPCSAVGTSPVDALHVSKAITPLHIQRRNVKKIVTRERPIPGLTFIQSFAIGHGVTRPTYEKTPG